MTDELRIVGDIAKVRLKPGDVLIVKTALVLSVEQEKVIHHHVQKRFPAHDVLVLPCGIDLLVARREAQ